MIEIWLFVVGLLVVCLLLVVVGFVCMFVCLFPVCLWTCCNMSGCGELWSLRQVCFVSLLPRSAIGKPPQRQTFCFSFPFFSSLLLWLMTSFSLCHFYFPLLSAFCSHCCWDETFEIVSPVRWEMTSFCIMLEKPEFFLQDLELEILLSLSTLKPSLILYLALMAFLKPFLFCLFPGIFGLGGWVLILSSIYNSWEGLGFQSSWNHV